MIRHRFDPLSFVFGSAFVVIAAIGLIDRTLLAPTDLRWIAPGALVVLGALLLALSARRIDGRDDDSGTAGRAEFDAAEGTADTATFEGADESGGAPRGSAEDQQAEKRTDELQPTAVEDDVPER